MGVAILILISGYMLIAFTVYFIAEFLEGDEELNFWLAAFWPLMIPLVLIVVFIFKTGEKVRKAAKALRRRGEK